MSSPSEHAPDAAQSVSQNVKLPQPKIKKMHRTPKKCRCPLCHRPATKHDIRTRTLHHLGDPASGRPVEIQLTYAYYYCCKCRKSFKIDTTGIAAPYADYTHDVMKLAVRLVVEDTIALREASWILWREDLPSRRFRTFFKMTPFFTTKQIVQ